MSKSVRQVVIRNVKIGADCPVAIQSMTDVSVLKIDETLEQINRFKQAGGDIMRVAVPDMPSVAAFAKVRKLTDVPLVADIHFDYRLAIAAIEVGADKIRINPGNILQSQLDKVIDCAAANKVPIRIGVNSGSVNKDALQMCGGNKAKALEYSIKQYLRHFEQRNFTNLVLSVKSTDVRECVNVNRAIAQLGYPLHLGITEAGLLKQGLVKNSVGIGSLLLDGIGDTIRVSLTADLVEEVYAAKDLLVALGLRNGVTFVSCPTCGRCSIDLQNVARKVYDYIKDLKINAKIAVMGCEVNGPGECRDADLGMAGANGQVVFFKKGVKYKTVDAECAVEEFKKEIDEFTYAN